MHRTFKNCRNGYDISHEIEVKQHQVSHDGYIKNINIIKTYFEPKL